MPAVLVELMFLNDDTEHALLGKPEVRTAAADAIVEGLRQYVEGTASTLEEGEMGM
jgi:N-acetylmuramoyl-L-alanine amidase